MVETARPKRRYDASGRRARAAQTRADVIGADRRVFLERRYAGATIPRIAAEAGVAVETVYRAAAGKAGLLEAAVQASKAFSDQRWTIHRVVAEGDTSVVYCTHSGRTPATTSASNPVGTVSGTSRCTGSGSSTAKGSSIGQSATTPP